MKICKDELIDALSKGCAFKVLFLKDGTIRIYFGEYHYLSLQSGACKYLQQLILRHPSDKYYEKFIILNQDILNEPLQEVKYAIMEMMPCKICGSPLFQQNDFAIKQHLTKE